MFPKERLIPLGFEDVEIRHSKRKCRTPDDDDKLDSGSLWPCIELSIEYSRRMERLKA